MKITEIEGIGKEYSEKLIKAGFEDVDDLKNLSKKQKEGLASKTSISIERIDKWQQKANLMSLKGIGTEYSDVLNKIGVASVKELAQRNPENLLKTIEEFDIKRPHVIRKIPTLTEVEDWITQANK